MDEKTVKIPNISCGNCTGTIERELGELPGVISVKGDPNTKLVTIQWNEPANWTNLEATLIEIGFPAE
jgi:copper chaperone